MDLFYLASLLLLVIGSVLLIWRARTISTVLLLVGSGLAFLPMGFELLCKVPVVSDFIRPFFLVASPYLFFPGYTLALGLFSIGFFLYALRPNRDTNT